MESMDIPNKTSAIFLDLKKAFDCLNHECLSQMLSEIGIKEDALKLINNYLANREQYVSINRIDSARMPITCGAPQGGVLSSLLFIIYINQIFYLPLKGNIQCYADDTCLVYSKKNFHDLKNDMTYDLKILIPYLSSINLVINIKKTQFLIFKSRNMNTTNIFENILINGEIIQSIKNYKYLGVVIDENLNWKNHVEKIANTISPYIGILRRLRYYVDYKTLLLIYYAHIESHLTYVLPVWGAAPDTYLNILKVLQNKSIKIIHRKPLMTPTAQLYSEKILSLHQKYIYESIFYIHKIKHSLLKSNSMLTTFHNVSNVNTRNANKLKPPNFKGALAQKSIYYNGLQLYNNLPVEIANNKDISKFKLCIKKYVVAQYSVE